MSRQSHGIQPKVRAVDVLLQHHHRLREQIFEVHPEVSFYYWNDHTPILAPKRRRDGKAIRQALIADQFGEGAFARARIRHSRKHVKDDDLADAFAALWTAERLLQRTSVSIPPDPPLDATGLPMRIVA
jgi:predicted RNase H-like nuclease